MWFPASVDTVLSSGLEVCVCLEPANRLTELEQEYFFIRLSCLLVLLYSGDSVSSRLLAQCQNDARWPFYLSFILKI